MNLSKAERAYACFGIGNSYYRMNKPGLAALNYRRALELSPYFTEAEYNLQFIERKEGAILPANTTENQWLTYIRHDTLGPISILSGAVMLTFLALLTVTPSRHGALLTILATLSGLVTVAAVMNYIMYPKPRNPFRRIGYWSLPKNARQTCGGHEQPCAHHPLPESTPLILRAERAPGTTPAPSRTRPSGYPGRTLSRCSALLSRLLWSRLSRNAVFPEGRLSFSRIQSSSLLKKPEPENGILCSKEKPGSPLPETRQKIPRPHQQKANTLPTRRACIEITRWRPFIPDR